MFLKKSRTLSAGYFYRVVLNIPFLFDKASRFSSATEANVYITGCRTLLFFITRTITGSRGRSLGDLQVWKTITKIQGRVRSRHQHFDDCVLSRLVDSWRELCAEQT